MGVRIKKAASEQAKSAADEVKKALDQIVREGDGRFEEAKEQVKASEQYSWWKSLSEQRRFVIGGAIVTVVFVVILAGIRALISD